MSRPSDFCQADMDIARARLRLRKAREEREAADQNRQARELRELLRDPAQWAKDRLGVSLWGLQRDILRALLDPEVDRVSVQSCHSAGKSFVAAVALLWAVNGLGPILVPTTAPTERQVKGILWREVHKLAAKAKPPLPGTLGELRYRLSADCEAMGFTARDNSQDTFQGFHEERVLVIVDEASGVSDAIYDGILSIMAGGSAKLLEIGNPLSAQGEFYRACTRGGKRQRRIRISAFDTPNFTAKGLTREDFETGAWEAKNAALPDPYPGLVRPEWVGKFCPDRMDSVFFRTRIDALFPLKSEFSLFDPADVEACANADLEAGDPCELVLDVARYGSDTSVLGLREGAVLAVVGAWAKADLMETVGRVVRALANFPHVRRVKVDAVGLGAGVVDRLRELQRDGKLGAVEVVEMNAGGAPSSDVDGSPEGMTPRERYANLRAEWYGGLADLVARRAVTLPGEERLAQELAEIRWQVGSSGRMQIEPKEALKKRLGFSTDYADMAVMAFAETPAKAKKAPEANWGAGEARAW